VAITSLGVNTTTPQYPHKTYVVLSAVPSAGGMNLSMVADPAPPPAASNASANASGAASDPVVLHLGCLLH
jgi:hypothetical protein